MSHVFDLQPFKVLKFGQGTHLGTWESAKVATIKIDVKQPGAAAVQTEVNPLHTVKALKERLGLTGGWRLWLGKTHMKTEATLQEMGVQEGAKINAIPQKIPSQYDSDAQYQAARRLENATNVTSAVHPELHAQLHEQTQSLVMDE